MIPCPSLGNCYSAYRVWYKLVKAQQCPFSMYIKIKTLSILKKN